MNRQEVINYTKTLSLCIISLTALLYPVFFLTSTTDFFVFPKQILLVFATIGLIILWIIQVIAEQKITFKSNPFTVPAMIFGAVIIASSFFSRNIYDSLLQSVPILFLIFFFFISVNTIENKKFFNIALSALTFGAVLSCIVSILYYFKLYILPIPGTQNQYLSTFGSPVQHVAYLLPILILTGFYLIKKPKNFDTTSLSIQLISSVIVVCGMILILYEVFVSHQNPLLLPFISGFQIALASISQDASRLLTGLLVGSGYGTFATDFTRFKLATFNADPVLWNLTFSYSSSYFLELIATTGILGGLAYAYLIFKIIKTRILTVNPLYIALIVTFFLSFVIPFSFSLVFLIFILLAFYTSYLYLEKDSRVSEVSLVLFTSKNELLSFTEQSYGGHEKAVKNSLSLLLPTALCLVMIPVVLFAGYYATKLFMADTNIAASLQPQNLNNGQKAYTLENTALTDFPYKSDYYVVFSQINYALANSLANSVPKNSSPSAQTQQIIVGLLQQSINSARAAATLSPLTSSVWQNLAQVYRNLINVGQNADQFSLASIQQAILLDPTNPQLYITAGGIYYQLQQWDLAIQAFSQAVNLKPDFANAHYNLGHAYEQKGDLQNALAQYQAVQQLVNTNPASEKQINSEISALQDKIGSASKASTPTNSSQSSAVNQPPLQLQNGQQTNVNAQNVKLSPPPSGEPTPTPTKSTEGTQSTTPTTSPTSTP